MLKTVDLEALEQVSGGNSFARYGGYDQWSKSARAEQYRDFLKLKAEGKVKFGRNGEWGSAYAAFYNNLTAGSRNPMSVAPRGSRQDNLPRAT